MVFKKSSVVYNNLSLHLHSSLTDLEQLPVLQTPLTVMPSTGAPFFKTSILYFTAPFLCLDNINIIVLQLPTVFSTIICCIDRFVA